MLRLKVLASVVPLAIAAFVARGSLLSSSQPCIAIANTSVEIASLPWNADLHVAFTEDPAAATVRVQITESADAADFAIVDDADTAETSACEANPATRAISISDVTARGTPSSISRQTARPTIESSSARRRSASAMRLRWLSAPASPVIH